MGGDHATVRWQWVCKCLSTLSGQRCEATRTNWHYWWRQMRQVVAHALPCHGKFYIGGCRRQSSPPRVVTPLATVAARCWRWRQFAIVNPVQRRFFTITLSPRTRSCCGTINISKNAGSRRVLKMDSCQISASLIGTRFNAIEIPAIRRPHVTMILG